MLREEPLDEMILLMNVVVTRLQGEGMHQSPCCQPSVQSTHKRKGMRTSERQIGGLVEPDLRATQHLGLFQLHEHLSPLGYKLIEKQFFLLASKTSLQM